MSQRLGGAGYNPLLSFLRSFGYEGRPGRCGPFHRSCALLRAEEAGRACDLLLTEAMLRAAAGCSRIGLSAPSGRDIVGILRASAALSCDC